MHHGVTQAFLMVPHNGQPALREVPSTSSCHFNVVALQLKTKLFLIPICMMLHIVPFVLLNYVKFYDSGSLLNFIFAIY